MNKIILMGRITRDIELKATSTGKEYCKFSMAVDRRFKGSDGNKITDFFNLTAWGGTAKFISQYFAKGQQIAIVGALQQQKYKDSNGAEKTAFDVNVEEAYFCGSKSSGGIGVGNTADTAVPTPEFDTGGFGDYIDDDLPPWG